MFSSVHQTSVSPYMHTPWTYRVSSQNRHTSSTCKQSHTRTLHTGTASPSRLLRLPLLSGIPRATQACMSLPFSFPASDGASKGGPASGKPQLKSATREGSGEEQTGSSYSQKRWGLGESSRGDRFQTPFLLPPNSQLWGQNRRGVWTGVSVCLLPSCWGHPEDLSVPVRGRPRMGPPQRVRTCWLLWFPLDKGGMGVGSYPACPPLRLMSVGNGETPSRAAGSYLGPGSGRGCPLVPGP